MIARAGIPVLCCVLLALISAAVAGPAYANTCGAYGARTGPHPDYSRWPFGNACYTEIRDSGAAMRNALESECRARPGFLHFERDHGAGFNLCIFSLPQAGLTPDPPRSDASPSPSPSPSTAWPLPDTDDVPDASDEDNEIDEAIAEFEKDQKSPSTGWIRNYCDAIAGYYHDSRGYRGYTYSAGHDSQTAASNAALARCAANACGTLTFCNGDCGAIASGARGNWAARSGRNADEARRNALWACERIPGAAGPCTVRYTQCSRQSG